VFSSFSVTIPPADAETWVTCGALVQTCSVSARALSRARNGPPNPRAFRVSHCLTSRHTPNSGFVIQLHIIIVASIQRDIRKIGHEILKSLPTIVLY